MLSSKNIHQYAPKIISRIFRNIRTIHWENAMDIRDPLKDFKPGSDIIRLTF